MTSRSLACPLTASAPIEDEASEACTCMPFHPLLAVSIFSERNERWHFKVILEVILAFSHARLSQHNFEPTCGIGCMAKIGVSWLH